MGVTTEAWEGWSEKYGSGTPKMVNGGLVITGADGVTLSGSGTDELGSWTWKGKIDGSRKLVLQKKYVGGKPHGYVITYTGSRKVSAAGLETFDGTYKIADAQGTSGAFQFQKQPHALEETYRGYYEWDNGTQHSMSTVLYTTSNNKIFGSGSDDIGDFTWKGEIDPKTGAVKLQKLYLASTQSWQYWGTKSFKNGRPVIEGNCEPKNYKFFLGVEGTPTSGPWTGYYVQQNSKHSGTNFTLNLTGSTYTGRGYDDIRAFIWEGELAGQDKVVLHKKYINVANGTPSANASVIYTGTISFKDGKQVIEGTWNFPSSAATADQIFRFDLPLPSPESHPFGVPVSIRSTATPNAYLRISGDVVNLQVGRSSSERLQLVLQGQVGGQQVYAIKSLQSNQYLHLDPTVSQEQKPSDQSPTFHPKGVGRAYPVKNVDELAKFTVQVNDQDGFTTHSLRLLNSGIPSLPKVFLRLVTDKLFAASTASASGVVNGQTYVGAAERLVIEQFPF